MKWLFGFLVISLVACSSADYRLLKNFYPATTDAPEKIDVSATFPKTYEEGALPGYLSLAFTITNNSNRAIDIDPAKINLMISTQIHSPIPAQSLQGANPKVNVAAKALKRMTLNAGESTKGTLYFSKTLVEPIKSAAVFNITMDAGMGKRIVVVFKP